MREIDFHFDIISPFAHVALARFGELSGDVVVRPMPTLLGPVLAHWGQRGPAEIAPKRLHTYLLSCFLGEKHGVSMRFPPRHPFNPLGAMRLLAGADADLDMVRRAFGFVFGEGRAPDTPRELAAFAAHVGVEATLASDQRAQDR